MALVKIKNDSFNINERIKALDSGYYVVYNSVEHRFEVHNKKQKSSSFCIICDNGLNCTVLDKLRKTKIENIQKLLDEIEESNLRNENEAKRVEMDKAEFKAREMFRYAKKNEGCSFTDSYTTRWC